LIGAAVAYALPAKADAGHDDVRKYLSMKEVILASLLGLATTSSAMIGVALGLYVPISKRLLGCILAFASGGLISALAIELAFHGAVQLHHLDFSVGAAWLLVGSGFAIGAIIYSVFSRYLEQKGAAVRYPTRFREFIQERREHDAKELIELLSRCDLLRHLPRSKRFYLVCAPAGWGPGRFSSAPAIPRRPLYRRQRRDRNL
jgi:zinc transporter ZupT